MNVSELAGRKIAVFDAEIKRPIDQCSKGWNSHDEMGVSCLVLFDYEVMRYRIFGDSNIEEALDILFSHDLVVGFNTVNFDWKLLRATYFSGCAARELKRRSVDFDILREIWISLGLNPDVFNPKTHGRYKLDDVAHETIGLSKTGDGTKAPILFQEGKLYELIDYCVQDVKIEKELFEWVVENGFVIRNKQPIKILCSHVEKA